jgi:hypothetical protein
MALDMLGLAGAVEVAEGAAVAGVFAVVGAGAAVASLPALVVRVALPAASLAEVADAEVSDFEVSAAIAVLEAPEVAGFTVPAVLSTALVAGLVLGAPNDPLKAP